MVNFHETCSFQTQQKLPIERFWKNSALVWLKDSRVVRKPQVVVQNRDGFSLPNCGKNLIGHEIKF